MTSFCWEMVNQWLQPCEASPRCPVGVWLNISALRLQQSFICCRWPVRRWSRESRGAYWAESGLHFCNWICMVVSNTPSVHSPFPFLFLPLSLHLPCFSLTTFHQCPLILPPISFTRIGLALISAAECICFHCSAPSQQMCINRPSGVVIANKDPACVQKRGAAAISICMAASSPI